MTETGNFARAANVFLATIRGIGPDQWSLPGLGVWDVRALVGHTSRAFVTTIDYLALEEPKVETIPDAETYYAIAQSEHADPAGVAQRGVDAGRALGDEPLTKIEPLIAHTLDTIEKQQPGRLVPVRGGSILLTEYLRTRLLEVVVHTLDVSRATGIAAPLPPEAIRQTLLLAAGIADRTDRGGELLLAITGRTPLRDGFSVV